MVVLLGLCSCFLGIMSMGLLMLIRNQYKGLADARRFSAAWKRIAKVERADANDWRWLCGALQEDIERLRYQMGVAFDLVEAAREKAEKGE